ncbi:IS200/IS605 family transposase [Scytonema sp. PCC 10023]|uniref:IS200/IS605 family transposase n=1 Tax=Scytonema sp. PCC 10023 TaxID=1680591 RepID=UPI0039C634D8
MKESDKQYRHNNHSVGSATVHLIWIPKRRKPVLVEAVKLRLSQILTEVANEKGWIIKCLEIAPDHVHVLVEYDPNTPINSIVKAFKGRSSRYLRQEFPHLLKLPTLWTHAYFYDTTRKVSSAVIEKYINDPHHYK